MALRILTGVIKPHAGHLTHGEAKISFDPHTVSGEADGMELEETGTPGRFISRPGKVVSMREFVGEDRTHGPGERDRFRIDDHLDIGFLRVRWECEAGAEIREISYLIVGEVKG